MPTQDEVRRQLEQGHSYEVVARQLGIPAGQAFMIATGLPADGGDTPRPEQLDEGRLPSGSPQQLVNPPAHNPTRNARVMDWVSGRAARDLKAGR